MMLATTTEKGSKTMDKDRIAELINARHYSLVTITKRDTEAQTFIIFEPDNRTARRIAGKWLESDRAGEFDNYSVNAGSTQGSNTLAEMCASAGRIIPIA